MLVIVWRWLCVACCVLFDVGWLLFVGCCVLFAACCYLGVVYLLLCVVCWLVIGVWCLSRGDVCCLLYDG